jgi:hypothetical protein
MPARIDIPPGTVFGRLTVISEAPPRNRWRMLLCQCECGQVKAVDLHNLRKGRIRSCGCLHREGAAELMRTNPLIVEYRHSDENRERILRASTLHGLSGHPHYNRWGTMMDRCHNPAAADYRNYGGRGIAVCPEWRDFPAFAAWIDANLGPCPQGMTLDRWPDNDGNYEPGNVRWATSTQQGRNKRTVKLSMPAARDIRTRRAAGESRAALAAEYGVHVGTIRLVIVGKTWRESSAA